MRELDFAYYLDSRQLLLLLSLIDQRPVYGLPAAGGGTVQDWQEVALSLLLQERLRYQGGNLVMDPRLGKLLLVMKDAEQALALYGKGDDGAFEVIYTGAETVCAEFFPDGGCRLGTGPALSVGDLAEAGLLPRYPAPEALEPGEGLKERLAWWEARDISMDDPPARWSAQEGVCGVAERLDRRGGRVRWIWAEDSLAGLLLRQDRQGIRAQLDTQSCRRLLAREWGMED